MFGYVIVNSDTLKIYIGQTTRSDLSKYLREKIWTAQTAKYKGRSHLYFAMQKYASTVWSIHPLIQFQTREELNQWELMMIKATASQNSDIGYNILNGGGGLTGWHHTPESRAKISASNQGKKCPRTPEQEAHRLIAWKQSLDRRNGSFQTPESITKIKESRVNQDEPHRLTAWKQWEAEYGVEQRRRSAATHRGMKHKPPVFTTEGKTRQDAGRRIRWNSHAAAMVGQRFGRLVIQSKVGLNYRGLLEWKCACDCGGTKIATTSLLRDGKVKSCGCLRRELARLKLEKMNVVKLPVSL